MSSCVWTGAALISSNEIREDEASSFSLYPIVRGFRALTLPRILYRCYDKKLYHSPGRGRLTSVLNDDAVVVVLVAVVVASLSR